MKVYSLLILLLLFSFIYADNEESKTTPIANATDEVGPGDAVITSDKMQADQKKKTITFSGSVLLVMDDLTLKCDDLIIQLDKSDQPKTITATGRMVQAVQNAIDEKGEKILRVATARKAFHDVSTEVTSLTGGPPQIQNGDQIIVTSSDLNIIEMNGKTKKYTIKGPRNGRTQFKVPMDGKGIPDSLKLDQKGF